jgi:peptide-methionine (S)-S-oxide reductase
VVDAETVRAFDERAPAPADTETATLALGCFWGPDVRFGAMEGVVRTCVGYAGGTAAGPTYHDIGDHSEALQVEFDPSVCSFGDLVDAAIGDHDPTSQPRKRQYQRVLFYETADQRDRIEERLAALDVPDVATRVEPLDGFTVAEDYHQKYHLRSKRAILSAFEEAGYDEAAIRESPAAATLNAEAAGYETAGLARRH